ncbi:MAG TPA: hypothetical protein VHN80_13275 [Kineosporiaceae bacterium]|jgi:hypothetical protein|nr:hypothetical protein [Kineosporiaceae bacterium]
MPSRSERSSTLRSVSVSIVLITPDSDRPNRSARRRPRCRRHGDIQQLGQFARGLR